MKPTFVSASPALLTDIRGRSREDRLVTRLSGQGRFHFGWRRTLRRQQISVRGARSICDPTSSYHSLLTPRIKLVGISKIRAQTDPRDRPAERWIAGRDRRATQTEAGPRTALYRAVAANVTYYETMNRKATEPETLDLRSHDISDDRRQELLRLFPEIRTEGDRANAVQIFKTKGITSFKTA